MAMPARFAASTTMRDLVGAADVAGVDAHRRDARVDRLQGERGVEVDVGDHRQRREPHDLRQRQRVLRLGHGAADELAACGRERGDLRRRRLDVMGLRQGHRLDDDGCAAADGHAADPDLLDARHPWQCRDGPRVEGTPDRMQERPPPTRWALERPPDDHPHDVWALGADLEAGTLIAAYELGLFPMAVDEQLVWWSPQARAVLPLGASTCPARCGGRRGASRSGSTPRSSR